uniref:Globin n=1 Tax=Hemiselmis andersenii TaxID=464988 RepID=A0A6T8NCP7_HEMAN|mmetsp:Transcript_39085/g.91300  ORF Transcript_39085/g.91300 Transcript_39085/m.91300 type:complete len:173 (-) Transcript_39085:269-787(-)
MQYMKEQAEARSGVGSEEAHNVAHLYEKVGEPAFRELSRVFYDKVYGDEEWFKDIFKGKDKESAIQNQCEFFMQRMGGPSLYTDRKGNHTLISRHKGWRVDPPAAERWLVLMQQSLDEVQSIDAESKEQMSKFFKYTAHLLVASKEVMKKKKDEQPAEVQPSGKDIILEGPS